MNNYPEGVAKMMAALESFDGVLDVDTNLQSMTSFTVSDLSLPGVFAVLPHLALRRSSGGRPNEALATFEFKLKKDGHGWIALEFLSWWVRDLNRSGYEVQLRPLSFPPTAGDQLQLGNALSFLLEIFIVEPDDDVEKIAGHIGKCADSLKSAVDVYQDAIKKASPKKGFFK